MMNTKRLLLAISGASLASLLVACGGENPADSSISSSETVPPVQAVLNDEMLAKLAKGFSLETTMEEDVNGAKSYSLLETQVLDGKVSLSTYAKASTPENVSKDQLSLRETYYRNEDGNVATRRIGLNNTPVYYEVIAPDGSAVYTWEETGYVNAFTSLKASNFSETGDGWFALDVEDLPKTTSTALMTQIYGTPGLELATFSLKTDQDGVKEWKATSKEFAGFSSRYNYSFESTVLETGENIAFIDAYTPFDGETLKGLEDAITSLKAYNFTCVIENEDEYGKWPAQTVKANADKLHYEYYDSFSESMDNVGYYVKDGLSQEVKKEGNDYIKVGTAEEGNVLEALYHLFNVSSLCFEEQGSSYRVKKGVDGELSAFTFLETTAWLVNDLTIQVSPDSYRIENTFGKSKTVITFTDIGSTDVGFTAESVKDPSEPMSWATLLPSDHEALLAAYGEAYETLPVPSFITKPGIDLIGDPTAFSLFQFEGETGETWVEEYGQALLESGYVLEEGMDFLGAGTPCYTKTYGDATYGVQVLEMPFAEVGDPSFTILFGDVANF